MIPKNPLESYNLSHLVIFSLKLQFPSTCVIFNKKYLFFHLQQKITQSQMESKYQPSSTKYKFRQFFGTHDSSQVLDQDIISCLKYDPTGKYLCVGDHDGRIIIFKTPQQAENNSKSKEEKYDYYAEFQSHVIEFDPLKGEQFSPEIIDISWLRPQGRYLKLLTTNTRSIKLWKAFQKTEKKVVKSATKDHMPKLQYMEPMFTVNQQHAFRQVHTSEINSISHSNNEQYMLSSDKEQNLLWSLQKPTRPYIANSIQDKNKNSVREIAITCSKMHPKSDSIFVYGMNRSELGLCDIRVSPTEGNIMDFGLQTRSTKNFFTDIIASVSSAEFMQNGKYIVSREYLNVKIWDMNNTKKPLHNICVQESLKSKLVNLFEEDSIYDRFNVACSSDSNIILTGNYNNCFHLLNAQNGNNTQYQLSSKENTISKQILPGKCPPIAKLDARKKTSALAFHPFHHSVAVASLNCFFIYSL